MKIRTQPSHCPRRGAALVLSLLFVLTVGALSLSLSSVQSTMERSHRFSQDRRAALYIAESGMAEASLALSQGKSGVIGSEETPAEFGQGLYWVETEDQADGSSILRCTAQVRSAEFVVKTTVLPNLNPVTSRGFFGLEGVELGQGTLIDGYDSTDGSYESQVTEVDPHRTTGLIGRLGTLKQVRFSAGSSSSQASSSSSSSEVAWGELLEQAGGEGEEAAQSSMSSGDSTEAESSVSANLPTTVLADIDGFVVASGTPVLGGDINPEPTGFLPPPTIRPGTAAEALGDVSILGTHTGLPQGESVGIEGDLILRPGATLRLNGPLILAARSLQLMSGAELLLDDTNGPILVFLEQGMDCAEDTRMESLAAEPEARGTSIVVAAPGDTPRPDLSLPSEGRFHGSLYAPGDRVEVPATLRWLGALTARRLTTAPGARLSFDVRLAVGSQAISTTPRITSWRIMPSVTGSHACWPSTPATLCAFGESRRSRPARLLRSPPAKRSSSAARALRRPIRGTSAASISAPRGYSRSAGRTPVARSCAGGPGQRVPTPIVRSRPIARRPFRSGKPSGRRAEKPTCSGRRPSQAWPGTSPWTG